MIDVLVGSEALSYHIPGVDAGDVDYFSSERRNTVLDDGRRLEVFYHPDLERYAWSGSVASLDELYTIKVSHVFWDVQWEKHMLHILRMQQAGAQVINELYDVLYRVWEQVHGPKKVSLEASADDFFNGNVKRLYEHDSVHQAVAFYDRPMFERILRDGSDVAVDKAKFDALIFDEKKALVFEECFVIALERELFARDGRGYKAAYANALKALVTRLSKGWFPRFIVENFGVFKSCPFDFYAVAMYNRDTLITV